MFVADRRAVRASSLAPHFTRIVFTPSKAVSGTLAVAIGAAVYELPMSGAPVTLTVAGSPSQIAYGFSSVSTLAAYGKLALP